MVRDAGVAQAPGVSPDHERLSRLAELRNRLHSSAPEPLAPVGLVTDRSPTGRLRSLPGVALSVGASPAHSPHASPLGSPRINQPGYDHRYRVTASRSRAQLHWQSKTLGQGVAGRRVRTYVCAACQAAGHASNDATGGGSSAGDMAAALLLQRRVHHMPYPMYCRGCSALHIPQAWLLRRSHATLRHLLVYAQQPTLLSLQQPRLEFGPLHAAAVRRILLLVCCHGDEPAGLMAVNTVIQDGWLADVRNYHVTVLLGNPLAVALGARFVEKNLNRCFSVQEASPSVYEGVRAAHLMPDLQACDVMLDLHTCSARAPAHALPGSDAVSEGLAAGLPVSYVIRDLAQSTPSQATSVDHVRRHGGAGMCVEAGQHVDITTLDRSIAVVKAFLARVRVPQQEHDAGGSDAQLWHAPTAKPTLLSGWGNVQVGAGFRWREDRVPAPFQRVEAGQVLAHDDINGDITAPFAAHLVMPTASPVPGEEAWFWGRSQDQVACDATKHTQPAMHMSRESWSGATGPTQEECRHWDLG